MFLAFIGLIGLVILHEVSHFILAKRFGVKIEEFGIFLPPRLIGKKIGETIYSLNLLPFGAFVKVQGEIGGIEDSRSFSTKPIWQKALIVGAGIISFWVISFFILTIIAFVWGLPKSLDDQDLSGNFRNQILMIAAVTANSPAEAVGLKTGDIILSLRSETKKIDEVLKIKETQDFITEFKGQEIIMTIKRGKEIKDIKITPSISPESGKGAVGIGLNRIVFEVYPWYQAPIIGVKESLRMTANIVSGWFLALRYAIWKEELPPGVKFEMMGPLGILGLLKKYSGLGINYFLYLLSFISIALALVNSLPIPALDGGKLVFLAIEKIKGKPINEKVEQWITTVFFVLLIMLMIFVTIKFDIPRGF